VLVLGLQGEEQYAERLKDIAAKRRRLNDEMAVQGQGIRAVYSMLDDVIMTLGECSRSCPSL
jgi:hypothetical protein